MESMAISKFKAECLAVLERVRKTHRPLLVTRFGKPVAQILPPPPPSPEKGWVGCMEGSVKTFGDLTEPAADMKDWEALGE